MTRPSILVGLTALFLMTTGGQGGPSSGIGWVPLSIWARENGFRLSALGNQSTTLTRREETLRFQNDSQVAVINGVNVWLCDPIMVRDGRACVSALDLKKSIEPILSPRQYRDDKLFQTICLDPGHGGKDTGGKVGPFMEKNFTLPLALELQTQLRAAGFKVWLTRTNDQFVDLDKRIAMGNQLRADLFISLHFNMAPNGGGKGVEVYCLTPAKASSTNVQKERGNEAHLPGNELDGENVVLAYQLQKALVKNLCAEDRGLRRARFAVLRPARMPAVLIEGGFLSDPGERQRISDPDYRSQMARAIMEGILDYEKAVSRESTVKSTEPILSQIGGRR